MPIFAILLLTGCEDMEGMAGAGGPDGSMSQAPEAVAALAAPNQDLTSVRLDPVSGCYMYRHAGPVETTPIPLRTADGRTICTAKTEPAPAT